MQEESLQLVLGDREVESHEGNVRVRGQEKAEGSRRALQKRYHGQKQDWGFPSKRSASGHLCPNVSRPFAKMRKELGVSERLVPYSARHTFGTAMLEMTGDVVFVGKLMGHKNPLKTTRYLHPSLHKAKELIDRRNEQAEEVLRHTSRHTEENEEVPGRS